MTAKPTSQQSASRRSGRRRKSRKVTANPAEFWGSTDVLPPPRNGVRITGDPSAVVRSLGRPPLSGHHNIAEHYFAAVYERSVALAGALAAAGDLIEPDELMNELD